MATAAPEMKFCGNCKRDIAASNFLMHEVFCKRNIVLCQQCKEPVSRSELEAHIEAEHTPALCNLCRTSVEKAVIAKHKAELCPKRIVPCSFCEMDCTFAELASHVDYCGSRTEPCLKCSQYIMKKDSIQHEASECSFPHNTVTKNSTQNNAQHNNRPLNNFAVDEFSRMVNNHVRSERRIPRVNNVKRKEVNRDRNRGATEDLDAILAAHLAEDLNAALSLNTSPVAHLRDSSLENFGKHLNDEQQRQQEALLPCEFCDQVFPMNCILQHQDICRKSMRRDKFSEDNLTQDLPQPAPKVQHDDHNSNDEVMIPCEFCSILLPYDALIVHQANCGDDTVDTASHSPAARSVKDKVNHNNDAPSRASHPQRDTLSFDDQDFAPNNFAQHRGQRNSPRRPSRHNTRGGARSENAFWAEDHQSPRGGRERNTTNKYPQRHNRGSTRSRGSRPPRRGAFPDWRQESGDSRPHRGRYTSPRYNDRDEGSADFQSTHGPRGRRGRGFHSEDNGSNQNDDLDVGLSQLRGTYTAPINDWDGAEFSHSGSHTPTRGMNSSPRGASGRSRPNHPRSRQSRGNRRPRSRGSRGRGSSSHSSDYVPSFASPDYYDDQY